MPLTVAKKIGKPSKGERREEAQRELLAKRRGETKSKPEKVILYIFPVTISTEMHDGSQARDIHLRIKDPHSLGALRQGLDYMNDKLRRYERVIKIQCGDPE